MKRLYFVRHGQTEWNAIMRMQGQWNSDLSELGREQADVNGQVLKSQNIEKLFDTILKQNVKSNSFFKVRSGIIGGKVEADEINDTSEDTLTSKQKIQKEKDDFLKWRKRVLSLSLIHI